MRKVLDQFIWDVVGSYSFCNIKRRQESERFLVLKIQGQSAGCFLTIFRGRKEYTADVSSIINSLNLPSQDSELRTE